MDLSKLDTCIQWMIMLDKTVIDGFEDGESAETPDIISHTF